MILISPSKTLDFTEKTPGKYTVPEFLGDSEVLIKILQKYSAKKLSGLMSLSDKLAALNRQRYQDFTLPFSPTNARQAVYAFKGDVYDGLKIDKFTSQNIEYAQKHLRILSGLYGLLKPLDLIQPYRLEMGTKLPNKKGKDLYKFWGDKLTAEINNNLLGKDILINLASEEYFKAINKKILHANLITPVFMEKKGKEYKTIMLFAKRARGSMAAYLIKNQIETLDGIKQFGEDGYKFNSTLSTPGKLVFTR